MLILQNDMSKTCLDGFVRLRISILGKSWTMFQICGYTGLVLSSALVLSLSLSIGLSLVIMLALIAVAVLTFLSLAMVTKILKRKEQIVYYHHQIAVVAVIALMLWILRQPVLPYLDVTILGLGVFLVFGRIGCFMVGCCHGRPFRRGVCYTEEHAIDGFTPYYVGVRLFPIQLVESVSVLAIVVVGVLLILDINSPGTVSAWYVVTYGFVRFCLEFLRGDAGRRYVWGYSEPQWTSLALIGVVVLAELFGVLQFRMWHSIAAAIVLLVIIGISFKRSLQNRTARELLRPRHVREVAHALDAISDRLRETFPLPAWSTTHPSQTPREILVARTSLGVQLSGSKIEQASQRIDHFALSHCDGAMTEKTAKRLARLIVELRPTQGTSEFLAGCNGVFHLLIYSQSESELRYS